MSGTFAVRRLRSSEWHELRELRLRALQSDRFAFGSTWEAQVAYSEEWWKNRALQGSEALDTATLVAVGPDGRLIGMVVVSDDGEMHRSIYSMWVAPEHRRAGVGGALLDRAIGWDGAHRPPDEVRLEVNPKETSAVALYRSRGFEYTGRSRPLEHTPTEHVHEMARPHGRPVTD